MDAIAIFPSLNARSRSELEERGKWDAREFWPITNITAQFVEVEGNIG